MTQDTESASRIPSVHRYAQGYAPIADGFRTAGRVRALASYPVSSERQRAEGHGGAENRGDPGLKANRPGSLTRRFGRSSDPTGGRQDPGSRTPKASAGGFMENRIGIDGRRGLDLRNAGDPERDRMQPTFVGVRPAVAEARLLNLNGQVQPGLGGGTKRTGSPGSVVPPLNSGTPQSIGRKPRCFPSSPPPPKPWPCAA
jgi:hypothetical protein